MEGDLDEADEGGQEESEEEEEEEDQGEDQEDEDEEDEDEQDEEDEEDEEESEAPQNNRTGRSLLSKRPRELDEDAEDTAALSEAGAGEVDGSERRRRVHLLLCLLSWGILERKIWKLLQYVGFFWV